MDDESDESETSEEPLKGDTPLPVALEKLAVLALDAAIVPRQDDSDDDAPTLRRIDLESTIASVYARGRATMPRAVHVRGMPTRRFR